jgi:hypothetical protein
MLLPTRRPGVSARFAVAIVDPSLPGFHDGDFDVSDATVFPLQPSDGVPGIGLTPDTFFAQVNSTVWIGAAVEEGGGPVTFDSDDYGTFTKALCNDNNNDGQTSGPFDNWWPVAEHGEMQASRRGTDTSANALPAHGRGSGVSVPGQRRIAHMTIAQDQFTSSSSSSAPDRWPPRVSATETKLEIRPQPGSTAHSLVRPNSSTRAGLTLSATRSINGEPPRHRDGISRQRGRP